jgi:hypothetical protein
MSAAPERVSRKEPDAAEMAAAAQAAAGHARYERLERRIQRCVHGLFWVLAVLWLAALVVISAWEWLRWHR